MKCPKCDSEVFYRMCNFCDKSIEEIYKELSQEAQAKREYDEAIDYLIELKKLTTEVDEREEIEKIIERIEFSRLHTGVTASKARHNQKNFKRTSRYSFPLKRILLLIVTLSIFVVGGIKVFNLYSSSKKVASKKIGDRSLKVGMLFNFEQALSPNTELVNKLSYNKILKILRKHKKLKFNLKLSGTLIQTLIWYSPETINLIKEGLKDGQFELLGSTYADNILYSSDAYSNKLQIERQLEVLEDVFNEKPLGFWNPGGVWKQEIANLILGYAYKYTLIEDTALEASYVKSSEHKLRLTENKKLLIINNDKEFMKLFNEAIDAGEEEIKLSENKKDYKKLLKYLRKIYEKYSDKTFVVNSALKAEDIAFNDFLEGENLDLDLENLDFILSELEKSSWIETVRYKDLLKLNVKEFLDPISKTVSSDLEKLAKGEGKKSEEGYDNWFEFDKNSPKLKNYRELHKKYAEFIKKGEKSSRQNIKTLIKLAKENFLSHQFKFGSPAVSGTDQDWYYGKKYEVWENIKSISVIKELLENLRNKKNRIYEKDVNEDNLKEVVVFNNNSFYVFSKEQGGRLLYWYDIKTGHELIGGELALSFEKYTDDNQAIEPFNLLEYSNSKNMNLSKKLKEYFNHKFYYVRHRALNEILLLKSSSLDIYKAKMNFDKKSNSEISFEYKEFKKIIRFTKDGFIVSYEDKDIGEIIVSSELQPGYIDIVNKGKGILDITKEDGSIKIYNKISKIGINLSYEQGSSSRIEDSLFGKVVKVTIKSNSDLIFEKYNRK